MHRTMIYIEDDDYRLLGKSAQLTGKRLSQLIREAIRYYLEKVMKRPSWENDPIWNMAGMAAAEQSNTDSRDHDALLYRGHR